MTVFSLLIIDNGSCPRLPVFNHEGNEYQNNSLAEYAENLPSWKFVECHDDLITFSEREKKRLSLKESVDEFVWTVKLYRKVKLK